MHSDLIRDFSLEGRMAVITGAASGIGRETARVLAQAGARVVLADVDEAGLDETAALVTAIGGIAIARRVDVADRVQIDALADNAAIEGDLEVWVNAAGVLSGAPILQTNEEEVDRLISINLKGAFWGCAAAGRLMKPRGRGSIVNIASVGADMPSPGYSVYSITKGGVNMLTRSAAAEFGAFGVRVNSVAPGYIDTPMVAYSYRDSDGAIDAARREVVHRERAARTPLGIVGAPRDIALAILYLATDASRYVTGQILRPNGGMAMP